MVGTIYLLSVLEAVGDITATAMVSRRPIQGEEYQSRLKGGVLADGLVSVIASAVGSLPLTTFAQNNGVIQMTGVASRYVGRTIAVMLVILGLFPMIGGFFTTIPSAVLGGAMTLMFSHDCHRWDSHNHHQRFKAPRNTYCRHFFRFRTWRLLRSRNF